MRVTFGTVKKLTVLVLLCMSFPDTFIRSVHPAEQRSVPHHAPPVPISMVLLAGSIVDRREAMNIHRLHVGDLLLLVALTESERRSITVGR